MKFLARIVNPDWVVSQAIAPMKWIRVEAKSYKSAAEIHVRSHAPRVVLDATSIDIEVKHADIVKIFTVVVDVAAQEKSK